MILTHREAQLRLLQGPHPAGQDLFRAIEPHAIGSRHFAQTHPRRFSNGHSGIDLKRSLVHGLRFVEAALDCGDLP